MSNIIQFRLLLSASVLFLELHILPKLLMDVIWVSKLSNTKIVSPVKISDPNMVVSAILILLMDVIWVYKLSNTKIVSPVKISDPNMVVSAILILLMDVIWVSILNHTAKHKDSFPCEDKWLN